VSEARVSAIEGRQHARLQQATALVVAVTILFELQLLLRVGGEYGVVAFDDLAIAVAAVFGGLGCIQRAGNLTRGDPERPGWVLLGLACWMFAAGQLGWSYYQLVNGDAVPFPSYADVGYVGALGLALAGVLRLGALRRDPGEGLRLALDAAVFTGSVGLAAWTFALEPIYRATAGPMLARSLSLLYPTGYVAIAAVVVIQLRAARGSNRLALRLLASGLGGVAAANVGYAVLTVSGQYATGNPWLDVGWFTPFLIIGLTGMVPPHDAAEPHRIAQPWHLGTLPSYVSIGLVIVTAGVLLARTRLGPGTGLVVAVVVLSTLARQYLTLLHSHGVARELEGRVTERTAELRRSREQFRALVHHSSDTIMILTAQGLVTYASPALQSITGRRADKAIGRRVADLVHPEDAAPVAARLAQIGHDGDDVTTLSFRLAHADGGWRDVESTVSDLRTEPAIRGLLLNIRDVTERRSLEQQLRHAAFHDALTGLANRALFRNRVEHALARRHRGAERVAVLFIDLDDFKHVNDSLGHAAGDELLVGVARRLTDCLRPSDTPARLGGDEFAILLEGCDIGDALRVARRVIAALDWLVPVAGHQVKVGASVGVALSADRGSSAESLLREADVAMYEAKALGKSRYAVFNPSMHRRALDRIETETALRTALVEHQIDVHYQPIIDVVEGRLATVEALARWTRPGVGPVPPSSFIGIAEESGLVVPLGRHVLERAALDLRRWRADGATRDRLRLNVNLSPRQLADGGLPGNVASILDATGLEPGDLLLEITETAVLPDAGDLIAALRLLRQLGVGIALDDFGTGYSSLTSLRTLPVDEIKIDRSFVGELDTSEEARRLVGAVIELGRALDIRVVAEGVETSSQLHILTELGCRYVQGHLLSAAVPVDAVAALVDSRSWRQFALGSSDPGRAGDW
jgi:diguanylate cyclase (GGDEF)-like protein/PAS domain S-box-containing protein